MPDDQRQDLASLVRALGEASRRVRVELAPLAVTVSDAVVRLVDRVRDVIPLETRANLAANILHFVAERDEALVHRERWVIQVQELANSIQAEDNVRWETLALFWIRLYGLHDLRRQLDEEATNDADSAARDAVDAVCKLLTCDDWEVVRFLRNNDAHAWAERHAVHWDRTGLTFHTKTFGGKSFHVRELAAKRTSLFLRHGGERGFARWVADGISPTLPTMIAAVQKQRAKAPREV